MRKIDRCCLLRVEIEQLWQKEELVHVQMRLWRHETDSRNTSATWSCQKLRMCSVRTRSDAAVSRARTVAFDIAAKLKVPNRELAQTLGEQIKSRHTNNLRLDQELKDMLLRKLNCVRECGLLVSEAKSSLSRNEFKQACNNIPLPMLKAYMAFAANNQEPISELAPGMRSIRSVMIALESGGLLPFSNRVGNRVQHLRRNPDFISEVIDACARLADNIRRHLRSHSLRHWQSGEIEALLAGLAPLLAVSRQLHSYLDGQHD